MTASDDAETPRVMSPHRELWLDRDRARFDHVTRAAALALKATSAAIVLFDAGGQRQLSTYGAFALPLSRDLFTTELLDASALVIVEATGTDSATIPKSYTAFPLRDSNGNAVGALCVMNDTAMRLDGRSQELLRELGAWVQGELQALGGESACVEALRSRLVAPALHVMRGALTSIHGFSEFLLREDPPQPQRQELLSIVHEQANHLAGVLNELTELVRLEADGAGALQLSRLSLSTLVQTTALTCMAKDRLNIEVQSELPAILADERRLGTAFGWLLSCAADLSLPGEAIDVVLRHEPGTNSVALTVQFASPPLQPGELTRLFEPFFIRTAEQRERSGIPGLALTRRLVEMHGGRVQGEYNVPRKCLRIETLLPIGT